ncbi:MAG: ATP-binding protein [Anaeromyxobacter sp.]
MVDHAVAAAELVDEVLRKVRRVSTELRPVLDHLGLAAALQHEVRLFGERHALRCELDLPPSLPAVSAEAATAVYRICQEALTNVARHAGAASVRVSLRAEQGALALRVEDDGRGIAPRQGAPSGLGLVGMRERAERLGGKLLVAPREGGGTAVAAQLPIEPSPAVPPSA